jgi:hypothetical protein
MINFREICEIYGFKPKSVFKTFNTNIPRRTKGGDLDPKTSTVQGILCDIIPPTECTRPVNFGGFLPVSNEAMDTGIDQ